MGRRGRKRQLLVEAEYWRLLQSGVGTVEASRCAGITRKTGYRWRFESGGLPPDRLAEDVRSTRYLSLLERLRIATLRERGHGGRQVREASPLGLASVTPCVSLVVRGRRQEGQPCQFQPHTNNKPTGSSPLESPPLVAHPCAFSSGGSGSCLL